MAAKYRQGASEIVMIIYATKQTIERYKMKMPSELTPPNNIFAQTVIEREQGDKLLEWGAKLFYFDKRKCIQITNFASKFTLFLVDIKMGDLPGVGNLIAQYLLKIYSEDRKMTEALERMFNEYSVSCFARLTDRSAVATLNYTQRSFLQDGYRLYNYIKDGILHTIEINKDVNFNWLFTRKVDNKTEWFYSGELFQEMVLKRFS